MAKIEAEEAGAFGEDIRLIVEVWIKHDAAAASMVEKILKAEKESSLKRCLDFMKGKAKKRAAIIRRMRRRRAGYWSSTGSSRRKRSWRKA